MISRIAAMLVLVCLATPAMAQTRQEQWDRCKSKDNDDLSIGACSALIQSGTETDTNLSVLFMNRGISYDRKRDPERALKDYEVALRLDPANVTVYYNRALIYLDRDDMDGAWRDAETAIRLNPGDTLSHAIRGEVFRRRGRFAEAAPEIEKALSSTTDDPDLGRFVRGLRAKNDQARRCGDADTDLSIGGCTAIIDDKTIDKMVVANAYNTRAVAHGRNENWEQVIKDHDESIRLNSSSAVFFANRGIANIWLGRYEQSAQDLDRSMSLDSKRPATISGQGLLARQQGNYAQALERFTAALLLSPQPPTTATASIISNRGITYLLMERYDEALVDLDSSLSINPKYAFGLFARGVTKRRKGDLAGGDADIAAARAIQSNIEAAMARRKVVI